MDIVFSSMRLQKIFSNKSLRVRKHGNRRANRIGQRLDDLRAANTLDDMRYLPGNCHELLHDRTGQLALDLDHPYRLIFVPANDPIPRRPDGSLNWTEITAVEIIGVEDYHD